MMIGFKQYLMLLAQDSRMMTKAELLFAIDSVNRLEFDVFFDPDTMTLRVLIPVLA